MRRPRHGPLRTSLPGLTALAVAVALSLDLLTYKPVGYDLAAYILAARRLLAGEPLYPSDPVTLGPFGQFVYPPTIAYLFVPVAAAPFNVPRVLALLGLAALAAWLVWYLARGLPLGLRYWAAAGVVQFFPLVWEVGLGNLTLVTLVLCLLAWEQRGSERRAGLLFAAALGLKLLPVGLVPYLLASGRSRLLGIAAAALGAVVLASLPLVRDQWAEFAGFLARLAAAPPGTGSNIVPAVFSHDALRYVLPATGTGVALVAGAAARRRGAEELSFRVALAAAPLLASTLWYPYLVFALPLLLWAPPLCGRLRRVLWSARGLAWLLMQSQLLRDPGRDFVLPLAGLLLLIAVGLIELAVPATRAGSEARAERALHRPAIRAVVSR